MHTSVKVRNFGQWKARDLGPKRGPLSVESIPLSSEGTSMKICCQGKTKLGWKEGNGAARRTQRYSTTQQSIIRKAGEGRDDEGGSEWVSKGPAPLLGRTIRNGKPADSRRRRRRRRRDDGIADLQHPGTG